MFTNTNKVTNSRSVAYTLVAIPGQQLRTFHDDDLTTNYVCVGDALLLMLCSLFIYLSYFFLSVFLSFFIFHSTTEICARFSSLDASSIELKLFFRQLLSFR